MCSFTTRKGLSRERAIHFTDRDIFKSQAAIDRRIGTDAHKHKTLPPENFYLRFFIPIS
jgi:hypothetical protein